MSIEALLQEKIKEAIKSLYGQDVNEKQVQLQQTRKDFVGDFTCVVFPFLRISKKKPEETAVDLGEYIQANVKEISGYNVIKGFLNLEIDAAYWVDFFNSAYPNPDFGFVKVTEDSPVIMVEYSSPNTNKPLHLGHIRNNVLGYSMAEILKANGYKVVKTNIVNDRGIHICKSMLAWQKFGNNETPESTGMKGDHLVGKYYVAFDKAYKAEIAELVEGGMPKEQAEKEAPLLKEAQAMLRKWEAKDPEVYELWKKMNAWVYAGFDVTYKRLGVDFDKIYYESDTYLLGKDIVLDNLKKGNLIQKEDKSIWADLKANKLDEKILLRADGTSVYMTQDVGTAIERHKDYGFSKHIYVVGNEQDYHFKVLSIVLDKFGFDWAKDLYHLSYGMVELPQGKMKSREGTVVDADDLMTAMTATAKEISEEMGKLSELSDEQKAETFEMIALAALKYFILKVDPKKTMLFNPEESVDFNGNTGPFIQYTYARIRSLMRKAEATGINVPATLPEGTVLNDKEQALMGTLHAYPALVRDAGENQSPALIANYVYDLVKEYNQFYHDYSVFNESNEATKQMRLALSDMVSRVVKSGMGLLGVKMPEKM